MKLETYWPPDHTCNLLSIIQLFIKTDSILSFLERDSSKHITGFNLDVPVYMILKTLAQVLQMSLQQSVFAKN